MAMGAAVQLRACVVLCVLALAACTGTAEEECPSLESRADWGAEEPREAVELQNGPSPYVIVHHTERPGACNTTAQCATAMRSMQHYHQRGRGWNDIGYNFVVGGGGRVFEGRGWGVVGAHAPNYNRRSVGIAFIGNYTESPPSAEMLRATQQLLACGVRSGHLQEDYRLMGHRQVRATDCPGEAFYLELEDWPHWVPRPDANFTEPAASGDR